MHREYLIPLSIVVSMLCMHTTVNQDLGNCWTWKQGRGEAYCGNYYGNNDYILLQGWVDPKSINWEETLVRNAWSLNEECEIFINDGQIVEVDKITINNASNGNYGKNILNRPMLIQT